MNRLLVLVFVAAGALTLSGVADDEETPKVRTDALMAWREALQHFRTAGNLIAQERFADADAYLAQRASDLPAAYGRIADQARDLLREAFTSSDPFADPFADDRPPALDFSFRARGRSRAAQLSRIASACARLDCYPAAAELCIRALRIAPDDKTTLVRQTVYSLRCLDDSEKGFAELESLVNDLRLREEIVQERNSSRRLRLAGDLVDRSSQCPGLQSVEQLHAGIALASDKVKRLAVYKELCATLARFGDERGFNAWLAKTVEEFGDDKSVRAEIYLSADTKARAVNDTVSATSIEQRMVLEFADDTQVLTAFYERRAWDAQSAYRYDEELRNYFALIERVPGKQEEPSLLVRIAEAHEKAARYRDALIAYQKIIALGESAVKEVPGDVGVFRIDWRGAAASGMSRCYEAQGNYVRAAEFAELVYHKFKTPMAGCLNCTLASQAEDRFRIAQLMMLGGRTEDALKIAEDLLTAEACEGAAAKMLVEYYHRERKLNRL
jgi:tetratricopeptide (TPR) repeat protein